MGDHPTASSLPELLREWQDWDVASHYVGRALGLFPSESWMAQYKGIFWTDNPLGNMLAGVLDSMVELGAVEKNSDNEYRWVQGFKVQYGIVDPQTKQGEIEQKKPS